MEGILYLFSFLLHIFKFLLYKIGKNEKGSKRQSNLETIPGLKTVRVFSQQRAHLGDVSTLLAGGAPEAGVSAPSEKLKQEAPEPFHIRLL